MVNLRTLRSYRAGSTTYYPPTTEFGRLWRLWRLGFHVPLTWRVRTPMFYSFNY